jgi:hypothetical protein
MQDPLALKKRKRIRWNPLQIFRADNRSGRQPLIRYNTSVNVGQAPYISPLDWLFEVEIRAS